MSIENPSPNPASAPGSAPREPRTVQECDAIGAELARDLLADLPPSRVRMRPLACGIFDFADALERVGALDVEALS